MNELALFAGAGGTLLGGKLLGWRTVCAVEIDEHCRDVLVSRQNDGCLDPFPIWDDIRTFDGRPWRGRVELVHGGFPCTDISSAGKKAGIGGKESGLWTEMRRIIGEVQSPHKRLRVFVENSPNLAFFGGTRVIADLAEMGFDCRWGVVGAHHAGNAPHKRDRIWILGDTHRKGKSVESLPDKDAPGMSEIAPHPLGKRGRSGNPGWEDATDAWKSSCHPGHDPRGVGWWDIEPGLGGVDDGMGNWLDIHGTSAPGSVPRVAKGIRSRTDRLKAIGNGQVPACAALAWRILNDGR